MTVAMDQWLTMPEVARRLDLDLEQAVDLIFTGRLLGEPREGRVRVSEQVLRRYESDHTDAPRG